MKVKLGIIISSLFLWMACSHAEPVSPSTPILKADDKSDKAPNEDWQDFYKERYKLNNGYEKKVNNTGDGFEPLYGVRNFRAVLNGVLYRGGANNFYHRTHPRDNQNPVPNDGLENLCKEGFTNVIYMYATNFETAPHVLNCESILNRPVTLNYSQISPYNDGDIRQILTIVHGSILSPNSGPVYVHCWNGWHASGLISALSLRQFCGLGAESAVKYWDANTDNNNTSPNFEKIRQQIRDFQPLQDLMISTEIQKRICPSIR